MPRIRIEPIVKAQSKTENLWEVTHFLDAEEIFTAIEFISQEHCAFSYLNVRAFLNPPNSSFEATFACKSLNLANSEFLQVLTQGANDGSLESFLRFQSDKTLQDMLSAAGLVPSSQNKEDLIKELLKKPDALIGTSLAVDFTKMTCVDLMSLRGNNRYIGFGKSALFFGVVKQDALLPQSTPQFWRIFPDSLRYDIADKLTEIEFFKGASSGIRDGVCILNLKESDAKKILEEYIEQNQTNTEKFDIQPVTLAIDAELVEEYGNGDELFIVHWPNNQRKLTDKFGRGKKTKFETLKFGLSLLDRLEPTKKLISAFAGKKIYLSLGGWDFPLIGIPVEKNVLEALAIHLKLEYLRGNTAICQVQEKITDEILNVIWEKTENNNLREARFLATQLTD
ncbi:hypothetical protein ES703_30955 [subsurface metagenome]